MFETTKKTFQLCYSCEDLELIKLKQMLSYIMKSRFYNQTILIRKILLIKLTYSKNRIKKYLMKTKELKISCISNKKNMKRQQDHQEIKMKR